MVDKIDDKKIRKISGTQMTPEVKKTEAVGQVGRVKGVSSVKGAGGPSGIRRQGTRMMTLEEREELFRLVAEEAEKLFPKYSEKQRSAQNQTPQESQSF